jgi:hypothetical protein
MARTLLPTPRQGQQGPQRAPRSFGKTAKSTTILSFTILLAGVLYSTVVGKSSRKCGFLGRNGPSCVPASHRGCGLVGPSRSEFRRTDPSIAKGIERRFCCLPARPLPLVALRAVLRICTHHAAALWLAACPRTGAAFPYGYGVSRPCRCCPAQGAG